MEDYLETRVMTASREQLHLMVVDGGLRHCFAARKSMEQGDREGAWSSLCEARAHVVELLGGVDPAESEVLDQTRALFKFIYRELMLADSEQSVERIDSAVQILEAHRQTWVQLMEVLANDEAQESAAPTPTQSLSIGA